MAEATLESTVKSLDSRMTKLSADFVESHLGLAERIEEVDELARTTSQKVDKVAVITPMNASCSDQLDKLFTALAKAQGDIGPAMTNKFNEFFKHGYADLGACLNAMREPLSKNGLSLIQIPLPIVDKFVSLKTILGHTTGQFITSTFGVMMAKDTPQEFGLVLTYLRRYSACSMVGVAQEDNDADDQREVSDEQVDQLMDLADKHFGKDANKQLARVSRLFNVNDITGLLSGNFEAAVNNLNQIKKQEKKPAKDKPKADKKPAPKEPPPAGPDVGDGENTPGQEDSGEPESL